MPNKVKPHGWSVAGEKIREKIKPGMPPEMVVQIELEANLQGVKDVFGAGVQFDAQGRPIETGIGSDAWLLCPLTRSKPSAIGRLSVNSSAQQRQRRGGANVLQE